MMILSHFFGKIPAGKAVRRSTSQSSTCNGFKNHYAGSRSLLAA
jgi:hypothetical protein